MKRIFFSIFMLVITTAVFSQVRFGVVGSPHISWMNPDVKSVTNAGIAFGVSAGLNMDFMIGDNENYAFSTGLLINRTGGNLQYGNEADTGSVYFYHSDHPGSPDTLAPGTIISYNLQYVKIPLSLKFKTNEIGYLKYFMHLGLTPQINVKANADADVNNITDVKIDDEVNLFSLGYHIGGGIEYSLGGNTSFIAAITYNAGFMDITTDDARKNDARDMNKDKTTLNNVELKIGILF